MGHRYQKGSKRPGPGAENRHHRDKGDKATRGQYVLSGGIPWPVLGDGSAWTDALKRVIHHELTEEAGTLQWVEWTHPGGTYMKEREKVRPATKTLPERREPKPGVWMAVVAWDSRETYDFGLLAKHPLTHLLPEPGE